MDFTGKLTGGYIHHSEFYILQNFVRVLIESYIQRDSLTENHMISHAELLTAFRPFRIVASGTSAASISERRDINLGITDFRTFWRLSHFPHSGSIEMSEFKFLTLK
jgi:hypothetical protein